MNLAERRIVEDFQKGPYPELVRRTQEAAGFPVEMEVEWETLAVPGESHLYAESWPQVYFEPLIQGLQDVARDEMGKKALKKSVSKIVVKHQKGCIYGDCWSSLDEGTLILDHDPITNVHDVEARKQGLVHLLESNL